MERLRSYGVRGMALLMIACSGAPETTGSERDAPQVQQKPEDLTRKWIQEQKVSLSSTDSTLGNAAELAPLLAKLGAPTVLGLGEANHGSHEFDVLKHRI